MTLKFTAKLKLNYVSAQRTRRIWYFPCCCDLKPDKVRGQRGRGQWQEHECRHMRLVHIEPHVLPVGALCRFHARFFSFFTFQLNLSRAIKLFCTMSLRKSEVRLQTVGQCEQIYLSYTLYLLSIQLQL